MEVTPMSALYRSPYEAYPFLSDDTNDLRCDFELLTDELASRTGLLHSLIPGSPYQESLLRVCELIYHANPTLRTRFTITCQELDWFVHLTQQLEQQAAAAGLFLLRAVLPLAKPTFSGYKAKALCVFCTVTPNRDIRFPMN